nr:hypothetical protein [Tanacetum cinerariifolium]
MSTDDGGFEFAINGRLQRYLFRRSLLLTWTSICMCIGACSSNLKQVHESNAKTSGGEAKENCHRGVVLKPFFRERRRYRSWLSIAYEWRTWKFLSKDSTPQAHIDRIPSCAVGQKRKVQWGFTSHESIWEAFEGKARDLGSIQEETGQKHDYQGDFPSDAFAKSAKKVKFLIKVVTSLSVETASEITTGIVKIEV